MEKFISTLQDNAFDLSGNISKVCPSNIALIKYWGKRAVQIPMNPSLSFTLNESNTQTTLKYQPKTKGGYDVKVYLDGELKEDFVGKIIKFFERIEAYIPFLNSFSFEIHTKNTFPHSSGIASSASGFGALSLCLVELEQVLGCSLSPEIQLKKASFLARLGSGSAARSVYPGITVWGETSLVKGSSDLYAVPYPMEIHPIYQGFRDTILLIDEGEKQVSSTLGHNLMNDHAYAAQRFRSAEDNLEKIIQALRNGDVTHFGEIVEHEALSLHAMMMTSVPYFILMKPNTLHVIDLIWKFRKETKLPLYFTLDAGANVHLLYPKINQDQIGNFIETKLEIFCQSQKSIKDYKN